MDVIFDVTKLLSMNRAYSSDKSTLDFPIGYPIGDEVFFARGFMTLFSILFDLKMFNWSVYNVSHYPKNFYGSLINSNDGSLFLGRSLITGNDLYGTWDPDKYIGLLYGYDKMSYNAGVTMTYWNLKRPYSPLKENVSTINYFGSGQIILASDVNVSQTRYLTADHYNKRMIFMLANKFPSVLPGQ